MTLRLHVAVACALAISCPSSSWTSEIVVADRLIEAMQKMPEAAARHAMTPERKARLEEAAKHPDDNDLERARMVFSSALN